MNNFEESFNERTVDGVCAVVFWPQSSQFDEQTKEDYIRIHLHDTLDGNASCWFCVKKNSIPCDFRVVFKVPRHMVSRVIGRKGTNAKKIAKALGGKHINIQTT